MKSARTAISVLRTINASLPKSMPAPHDLLHSLFDRLGKNMNKILLISSSPPLSAGNDLLTATLLVLDTNEYKIDVYARKLKETDLDILELKNNVKLISLKDLKSKKYNVTFFITQDLFSILTISKNNSNSIVAWIHEVGNIKRNSIIKSIYYEAFNYLALLKISNFIVADKEILKRYKIFFRRKYLYLIPIPYIVSDQEINDITYHDKKYDFIFIGDNLYYKGLDILMESVRKASTILKDKQKIKLIIISKNKKENYSAHSIENQLEITHITEKQGNAELQNYISLSRYVVIPYRSVTATSLIALAFFNKTPVISSDLGYLKDHLQASKSGLLFKASDKKSLEKEIITALQVSDADEKIFQENACKYFKTVFSIEAYKKNLKAMLNQCT